MTPPSPGRGARNACYGHHHIWMMYGTERGAPARELVTSDAYDVTGEAMLANRAVDGSFVLVYSGQGRELTLDPNALDAVIAFWLDPRTAEVAAADTDAGRSRQPLGTRTGSLVLDGSSGTGPNSSMSGTAGQRSP